MLHRVDPLCEQALLHARILDVLEALIGPDVLCLQTMLFYNAPGMGGQGWHQDSYYITTYPDTLIGSWLALERADEGNGCLWVAAGSHRQPIYPDRERGSLMHTDGALTDLTTVEGVSHLDDAQNTLAPVAGRYEWLPAVVEPGDVIFFHGHVLHRSYPNGSADRWRRAFVSHYCNARSWVPWNHGAPFEGDCANAQHILGRGTTHLPYAQPLFGTPCAATEPQAATRAVAGGDGMMTMTTATAPATGVNAWDPGEAWKKA
jgi:chlorinating enzyme